MVRCANARSWDCPERAALRFFLMRYSANAAARLLALCLLLLCVSSLHAQPAAEPRFAISAFVVEGNTVIEQEELGARVAPFIGPQRAFSDIQDAALAIATAYRERGYEAVRVLIPEQDIRTGVVRLRVVEARVRRIRVEGNRHFDEAQVRASLPALRESEPPNTREISANVSLANESPVRQAHVAFEAAPEAGAIDAVVRVTDESPVRGGAFLDNSGNASTGHYRAGVSFMHADVAGADHVLNVQLVTSPTQYDDVMIVGAGYRAPLYEPNLLLEVYGGRSDVNSGTLQDLFSVSGSGALLGVRLTRALPRIGRYEHKAAMGVEWKAFENDVVLLGTSGTLVPDVTTRPFQDGSSAFT